MIFFRLKPLQLKTHIGPGWFGYTWTWAYFNPGRQDCREEGDCQEAAVAGGSESR